MWLTRGYNESYRRRAITVLEAAFARGNPVRVQKVNTPRRKQELFAMLLLKQHH